jgi:hypothetical protein
MFLTRTKLKFKTSALRYSALNTSQSAYFRVDELIVSRSEIDLGGDSKQKRSAPQRDPKSDLVNSLVCGM